MARGHERRQYEGAPMMDEERDDRETTEAPGTTRRRLLSAATGNFALATSGLFLPEWPEEMEAREGALGGATGGRLGKGAPPYDAAPGTSVRFDSHRSANPRIEARLMAQPNTNPVGGAATPEATPAAATRQPDSVARSVPRV